MSFVLPVGLRLTQRGLAQCTSTTNLTKTLMFIMLTNSLSFTILTKVLRRPMLTKPPSIAILAYLFTCGGGAWCTPTTRLTIVLTYIVRTQPSPTTLTAIMSQYIVFTYSTLYCYTLCKSVYLSCAYTYTSPPFCRNTVVVARRGSVEALFDDTTELTNDITSYQSKSFFLDVTE